MTKTHGFARLAAALCLLFAAWCCSCSEDTSRQTDGATRDSGTGDGGARDSSAGDSGNGDGGVADGSAGDTSTGDGPADQDQAVPSDSAPKTDINLAIDPLPEGNTGIAAKHKGDVGIINDPAVIFADDFESYASAADLWGRWDNVFQNDHVAIVTQAADVYRGSQALQFDVPVQSQEMSNATTKELTNKLDVLFLRYYSKFDAGFDVLGSSHNGSCISAGYFINGQATPGIPANGTNKYLACYECWRGEASTPNPGHLNVYIYHPEQRSQWGDHFFPTGLVMPDTSIPFDFGPTFVARPDVAPQLGQWHSYEFMIKANTPGQRDGRIACWLDGDLIADFPNLRLRDIDTLKIDQFDISLHVKSNTAAVAKKWYDNVVAATSYIGPLVD